MIEALQPKNRFSFTQGARRAVHGAGGRPFPCEGSTATRRSRLTSRRRRSRPCERPPPKRPARPDTMALHPNLWSTLSAPINFVGIACNTSVSVTSNLSFLHFPLIGGSKCLEILLSCTCELRICFSNSQRLRRQFLISSIVANDPKKTMKARKARAATPKT